jgi:transposase
MGDMEHQDMPSLTATHDPRPSQLDLIELKRRFGDRLQARPLRQLYGITLDPEYLFVSNTTMFSHINELRSQIGAQAMPIFSLTHSAEQKGYDAGKKVSRMKRHIGVDTQGLPHVIAITTAEVTDRNGALQAIDRCRSNLERVESVLVDGGYTGQPFADGVKERLEATVQVVKRDQLHTFVVLPKRWVVERSFALLEKCRRLWKNCERKLNTSLQFVHLAFLVLLLRRS